MYGPRTEVADLVHSNKYRLNGESFLTSQLRLASVLADDKAHFKKLSNILLNQRFLPGGRIQAAIGSPRQVTAINCFVLPNTEDSMTTGPNSIMGIASKAAETMRLGGGVGYYFGNIRPKGDKIHSVDAVSSGPISFMHILDAMCKTISSAGNRRGAQMMVMPCSHPDIFDYIEAKHNTTELTAFNLSIAVTDEFMNILKEDGMFPLTFNGKVYKEVKASELWDKIMKSTWDWAEPGVIFIDTMNEFNNLTYCETIYTTNPCSEQPLPPNGSCLLGSFNLTKYLNDQNTFDFGIFIDDIPVVIRAMDNVIDNTIYPLKEQEMEEKNKRRMGIGYTGLANTIEIMGFPYGSKTFLNIHSSIARVLMEVAYTASAMLAAEKRPFPLYDERYLGGKFIKQLQPVTQNLIRENGIRNSHLISIAPTGSISLTADNVSSGIEPVFSYEYERDIQTPDGKKTFYMEDYAYKFHKVKGKLTKDVTIDEHLAVLEVANQYCDSSVSKTCNVPSGMSFDEFKKVYFDAWEKGIKAVSTFNVNGKRFGVMRETIACYIDPETGDKTCD